MSPAGQRHSRTPTQTLPGPVRRSLVEGQILCREGDPAGPLYVICSGSVRAYRTSLAAPDSIQELARLGPGAIVGELAAILKQLRTATVQALEPTEVLELPPIYLGSLTRRNESLLRVLTLALKERTGLPQAELEAAAMRLGITLPRALVSEGSAREASAITLPVPPYDRDVAYTKALTCPACGSQFSTLVVHARKDQPVDRATDFHQRYETPFNPYDYELWVCPNDLYAALPADFGELSEIQRSRVADVADAVVAGWGGQRPDFNAERSLLMRERGLELALALYRLREASPARLAAILHRLAWCARERGDRETERARLSEALEAYIAAFTESDVEDVKDELRVQYLCGELSARLGDTASAVRWFAEALKSPGLKDHHNWEKMIRDRWADVRSTSGPTEPAAAG